MEKNVSAQMPPGTPLLAKTSRAAEVFDISPRQLFNLRRYYPELAARTLKIGRDVYYDIPGCYEWFRSFLGMKMETED